jgi:hypothetical protein
MIKLLNHKGNLFAELPTMTHYKLAATCVKVETQAEEKARTGDNSLID